MSRGLTNFETFLKSSGLKGVREVALVYALEGDTTTIDEVMVRYRLSKRAVRHCIKLAIVECLIDYATAIMIKQKAHRNQAKHLKETSVYTKSDAYFDKLLRERAKYIETLPEEKIYDIAYLYMANPKMPVKELAKELNLSYEELNIILKKAITDNIVEDGIVSTIEANSISKCTSPEGRIKMLNIFVCYEMIRLRNKAALKKASLEALNREIDECLSQLNSVRNFASSDDLKEGVLSEKDLQLRLFELGLRRDKLLNS